jgi:hypothetical protein
MHPNSILQIIPPREIENYINRLKPTSLHVYVDFKNSCRSLFIEDVVKELVLNSKDGLDTTIFQSMLFFSSYWKRISLFFNIPDFKIFFCYDIGKSSYHQNIDNKYKKNRDITSTLIPDYFEDMVKIRNQNCLFAEKVCNKFKDIYFFNLSFLESDFLPYYLIKYVVDQTNTLNIICSNDKDLLQNLRGPNNLMLFKANGTSHLINESSVLTKYTGVNKKPTKNIISKLDKISSVDISYLSAIMAVVGDAGDDVPGVKGLGPMRVVEMFSNNSHVIEYLGTFDEMVDRVMNGGKYFKKNINTDNMTKYWKIAYEHNDLITKSFKLISFECLCRWLNNRKSLECKKHIDYIYNIMSKENDLLKDVATVLKGLSSIKNMYLTENELDVFFK